MNKNLGRLLEMCMQKQNESSSKKDETKNTNKFHPPKSNTWLYILKQNKTKKFV